PLENAQSVSPDAKQAQALRIFPRHMLGGDRYNCSSSQGPKWKTHEREQLTGFRIKKQRVHPVAAAETAIRAQSYSYTSRSQSGARDDAQAAVTADRNMIGRMGHDLALHLLPVGVFDQLDRFLEIEQGSQLITTQKQRHSQLRRFEFESEILHFVQDDNNRKCHSERSE